jgi:hypothetical protein
VTGLEINSLEVDFSGQGQGLDFIRIGGWLGFELWGVFVAHYGLCYMMYDKRLITRRSVK